MRRRDFITLLGGVAVCPSPFAPEEAPQMLSTINSTNPTPTNSTASATESALYTPPPASSRTAITLANRSRQHPGSDQREVSEYEKGQAEGHSWEKQARGADEFAHRLS
jgi:hypothetical protein